MKISNLVLLKRHVIKIVERKTTREIIFEKLYSLLEHSFNTLKKYNTTFQSKPAQYPLTM